MLRYRLIFGTLMACLFVVIVLFDAWIDGSMNAQTDPQAVQATLLFILVSVVILPAQLEIAKLAEMKKISLFKALAIPLTIIYASFWYWRQFLYTDSHIIFSSLIAMTISSLFLYQRIYHGTENVISNCSVTLFSIGYLGCLGAFILGIRIDFGIWPFLMYAAVVKSSDIGAYTFGKSFGKHKFSPRVSPAKTWEGMIGAILFAVLVSLCFAYYFGIMNWPLAIVYGVAFAFIGQLGDLAESMLKRDAHTKDSSSQVPGFGGILDVIDSPLIAAPFSYWYFMMIINRG